MYIQRYDKKIVKKRLDILRKVMYNISAGKG
jgi:hypothetical protein